MHTKGNLHKTFEVYHFNFSCTFHSQQNIVPFQRNLIFVQDNCFYFCSYTYSKKQNICIYICMYTYMK